VRKLQTKRDESNAKRDESNTLVKQAK
jgi:hypothetical protein